MKTIMIIIMITITIIFMVMMMNTFIQNYRISMDVTTIGDVRTEKTSTVFAITCVQYTATAVMMQI